MKLLTTHYLPTEAFLTSGASAKEVAKVGSLQPKRGFTFIEILVAVTLIIIISGMGMVYYNNFTEQKKLEQETKKLSDLLTIAKAKANAGDTSLCGGPNPAVNRFTVKIYPTGYYQLIPECLAGNPTPFNYQILDSIEVNLTNPDNPDNPPANVDFFPVTNQTSAHCMIIESTRLNKCNYVNVNEIGIISDGTCSTCSPCTCPTPSP